jgi:hypothetical protein
MSTNTRTDRDLFIAALIATGERIGNYKLAEVLEWDAARYNATRDALVAEGIVTIGRGRGGTIYFADADVAAPKVVAPKAVAPKAVAPKAAKTTVRPVTAPSDMDSVSAVAAALDIALAGV